jgi:hypothetical protein
MQIHAERESADAAGEEGGEGGKEREGRGHYSYCIHHPMELWMVEIISPCRCATWSTTLGAVQLGVLLFPIDWLSPLLPGCVYYTAGEIKKEEKKTLNRPTAADNSIMGATPVLVLGLFSDDGSNTTPRTHQDCFSSVPLVAVQSSWI